MPDGAIQGRPRAWLPDTDDEFWATHPEYLDGDGYLVASVGGLLVEQGDRALLIDAGLGPQSAPADPDTPNGALRGGALLDNLAALGRRPDDIEAVAFTHLHPDHTGWARLPAPGGDRPPFAHAEHLVTAPEWAAQRHLFQPGPRVRALADGEEVLPGVRVRIAAGHTPGHAEYVITGGGLRLIAFGDALHSPVQADHPEFSCVYDHDPAGAAHHRRQLLAELERPDALGFGIHLADVPFGRVRRGTDGPAWQPASGRSPASSPACSRPS